MIRRTVYSYGVHLACGHFVTASGWDRPDVAFCPECRATFNVDYVTSRKRVPGNAATPEPR